MSSSDDVIVINAGSPGYCSNGARRGRAAPDQAISKESAVSSIIRAAAVQISPELLSLLIDRAPASHVHERAAHPSAEAMRAAVNQALTFEPLNQEPFHRTDGLLHKHGNVARNSEGIQL